MASNNLVPTFKNRRTALERVDKFISKHHFTDCNLYGKLYGESMDVLSIKHLDCAQDRPKANAVIGLLRRNGQSVSIGHNFGPTWSTHWFQVEFSVPKDTKTWHFIWNAECEAMIYDASGEPIQGLSSDWDRIYYELPPQLRGTPTTTLYIECACNNMFGAGEGGQINPPKLDKFFTLKTAKLSVFHREVNEVYMDLELLYALAKDLDKERPAADQALNTAYTIVNLLCQDPTNYELLRRAHQIALSYFNNNSNEQDAVAETTVKRQKLDNSKLKVGEFRLYAIGNCHIDTAWLWPYAETKRKCARSWLNTLNLMKEYPELNFAVSQAQQLAWLRDDYPTIFDQIKAQVANGRFIPVGGCWVEMDGNLPSGESFVRQLLYGQQFFKEAFGSYCTEFWLPDTFGYSAQLPQIMNLAGIKHFLTQKISWNLVNKFPHNTFYWKGIDGTKVLTHFPPGGNYCREVTIDDCLEQVRECQDRGRCDRAMVLYGHGDGGGGPTMDMCQRLRRLCNADTRAMGLDATVVPSTPAQFFDDVTNHDLPSLCTWSGELYLELHQGTYTTQAVIKRRNRQLEMMLHNCELLASMLFVKSKGKHIYTFDEQWKGLLLNQFHDVLPGSSIVQVYVDANQIYDQIEKHCNEKTIEIIQAIIKDDELKMKESSKKSTYLLNSLPWERKYYPDDEKEEYFTVAPMSLCKLDMMTKESSKNVFTVEKGDELHVRSNKLVSKFLPNGQICQLQLCNDRIPSNYTELVDNGVTTLNRFVLYHDVPLYWDAWDIMDYHVDTGVLIETVVEPIRVIHQLDNCVKLEFALALPNHTSEHPRLIRQVITISEHLPYIHFNTTVNWHENHSLLKWEHATNIVSDTARYDIQFGYVDRPTHRNTSWDAAKYEVCAHKYALLADRSRGLALLNNGKYGHSCYESTIAMTLLRSPKAPDPNADMGDHVIETALMPFMGHFDRCLNTPSTVVQASMEFNNPIVAVDLNSGGSDFKLRQMVSLRGNVYDSVILDTIKISEARDGLIFRFYESLGGEGQFEAELKIYEKGTPISEMYLCNLLEQNLGKLTTTEQDDEYVKLRLGKFQLVSLYAPIK